MGTRTRERLLGILCFMLVLVDQARAATIRVSADAGAGAPGTAGQPCTLVEALARAVPGDVIEVFGGTYRLAQTLKPARDGTQQQPIRIQAIGPTRPVLDFSQQAVNSKSRGLELGKDWWHVIGIEITRAGDNGINITGHHNTIERCVVHSCADTGIQIHQPASHTLVLNCDSYRNYDERSHGENADGFAAKFDVGEGNVFRGCRAWENSDDGWDLWKAPVPVRIEDCVAFRNGVNVWNAAGFTGNGNGFKLGGDYVAAAHVVVRCVAIDQPKRGFDQNNNTGSLTIEDSTAVRCAAGFHLPAAPKAGQHVLRRNVAFGSPNRLADGVIEEANQWLADASPGTQPASRSTSKEAN